MMAERLHILLEQHWGYKAFRPFQQEIIQEVLTGRDVFAMLPTGGGKSVCYQLPALAADGFCLVISPLIALMQDQVLHLEDRGIPAACIHSAMGRQQIAHILDKAAAGHFKLLYVSPERLQTEAFLDDAPQFSLNLIAIDEAHCISQWGHDFRPAYLQIKKIKKVFPGVPMLALTATATEKTQKDILAQLELRNPALFRQSIVRSNLSYHVRFTENKAGSIVSLFRNTEGSGIIYCRNRKKSMETALLLRQQGIESLVYHAGLKKEERACAQERWTRSHHAVMSATTAFGMGIDKPDVRAVAHIDVPDNLEAYYQEAGRAGRDGITSVSILYYHHRDLSRLRESTAINYPSSGFLRQIYQYVGDFLQLPVGSGKEQLFAFDAMRFIKSFGLETLRAVSAVRLLAREGLWIWDENTQTQPVIRFIAGKETLAYLERSAPQLSYVATGLLRLYGGIFHFPTPVNLWEISRLLRLEQADFLAALDRLAAWGIIDYRPALAGSTLYWMHDRVKPGHLLLDQKRIRTQRAAHAERVRCMVAFLENGTTCRNVQLARYFGEQQPDACGACDVCLGRAAIKGNPEEIRKQIREIIEQDQQITVQALTSCFPGVRDELIIGILRRMSDEGMCTIHPNGTIFIT